MAEQRVLEALQVGVQVLVAEGSSCVEVLEHAWAGTQQAASAVAHQRRVLGGAGSTVRRVSRAVGMGMVVVHTVLQAWRVWGGAGADDMAPA